MEIKDIMKLPVLINCDSTLEEVVKTMVTKDVNSILVVNEKEELIWVVDIVTLMKTIVPDYVWNRDLSVAWFVNNEMFEEFIFDNKNKKVKYFMMWHPKTIKIDSSVLSACIKVTEWRQTRIAVVDDNNKPLWILTRRWVKKFIAFIMWIDCK